VGLFSVLGEGEIKITTGSKELFLAIGGGFMEVEREKVSILVSRAVHADELNEHAIKEAQDRAFAYYQPVAWLYFEAGKAKVSPDTVGIPKP